MLVFISFKLLRESMYYTSLLFFQNLFGPFFILLILMVRIRLAMTMV